MKFRRKIWSTQTVWLFLTLSTNNLTLTSDKSYRHKLKMQNTPHCSVEDAELLSSERYAVIQHTHTHFNGQQKIIHTYSILFYFARLQALLMERHFYVSGKKKLELISGTETMSVLTWCSCSHFKLLSLCNSL